MRLLLRAIAILPFAIVGLVSFSAAYLVEAARDAIRMWIRNGMGPNKRA